MTANIYSLYLGVMRSLKEIESSNLKPEEKNALRKKILRDLKEEWK